MRPLAVLHAIAAVMLVAGCASVEPPPAVVSVPDADPAPPRVQPQAESPAAQGVPYACDNGLTVHARFGEGAVTVSGLPQGEEVLLRDAGGVTPEQTVWSNEHLRAEFGLPPGSGGASLQLLQPQALTLHCQRQ